MIYILSLYIYILWHVYILWYIYIYIMIYILWYIHCIYIYILIMIYIYVYMYIYIYVYIVACMIVCLHLVYRHERSHKIWRQNHNLCAEPVRWNPFAQPCSVPKKSQISWQCHDMGIIVYPHSALPHWQANTKTKLFCVTPAEAESASWFWACFA